MKLNLIVDWDIEGVDPQVEAALDDIISEEARSFADALRRRLASEGVTDISTTLRESSK